MFDPNRNNLYKYYIIGLYSSSIEPGIEPTLVRVMLNWMVRMTTRMSKLPSEISVNDLSVYQVMFFSTCQTRTRGNGDGRQHQPEVTSQNKMH